MKLYATPTSPFVRKVMICAYELDIADQIELERCDLHPFKRLPPLVKLNPLGQVPTLVDDCESYYDSSVICELLNMRAGGKLIPQDGRARLKVLRDQALADGLMDAAVLIRLETLLRDEAHRSSQWIAAQHAKITSALEAFASGISSRGSTVDLGAITLATALGYLDFRLAEIGWRTDHPGLAQWFAFWEQRSSHRATADLC
ncbi:glutathione S-transferase N-terminal domain-containing protein [Chelativorans sp. Marseille-P2723]|uniref:glutathione S-transferase n=1 Tax=Chelativorans sp. Marseille-P2723 TaxID=2709133 RepID=UPI00157090E2|nr:glutathione S-transferase N-terminal domain-containing protein [Chelativorans sp. Marseille-P2723]